jgi:hypothetical protein
MPLPVSPSSISMAQINTELAQTTGRTISLNDTLVRSLFTKTTANSTISFSDGYGKSKTVKVATPVVTVTVGNGTVRFDWDAVTGGRYYIYLNGSSTAVEVLTNYKEITGLNPSTAQTIRVYITKTGDTTSSTSAIVSGTSWALAPISNLNVKSGNDSITFTWDADATVTYIGGLDGATQVSISSPKTYSGLTQGNHTLSMTATKTGFVTANTTKVGAPLVMTPLTAFATATAGTLATVTTNNYYSFVAAYSIEYQIAMTRTDTVLDPYLEIYDSTGLKSFNDDGGGRPNSLLRYPCTAGQTYYIYARSYQLQSKGTYTIALTRSAITLSTPIFKAATGGVNSVSFEWNAVTDAQSYDVSFNGGTAVNQTGLTYSVASGIAAGSYTLSVIAKSSRDTASAAGVSSSVTVTNAKLATPLYSAVAGGVNSVSSAWTAVTNATSYDVTFNGSTTNQTGTTFNITSGVAAGTYSLSVVAKATNYPNSNAAASGNIIVTNAKLTTPSFTVATGSVNQVSFTWSTVSNATSYEVTFNSVTTNQTSTTFTSVNTLTPGTYYLFVKAKAANYPDSDVNYSSAVATAPAIAAVASVSIASSDLTATSVKVTVTKVTGGTPATYFLQYWNGYWADYSNNTTGVFANIAVSAPNTYYFRGGASNASNTSIIYSDYITVVPVAALARPGKVTLTVSNVTSTTARITATTNSGGAVDMYYLFKTINGTNTFIMSASNGIFDLPNLEPSTLHGPYVSYAGNTTNISEFWSYEAYIQTSAAAIVVPSAPTLTVSNLSATQFDIQMTATNANNYLLFEYVGGSWTYKSSSSNGAFNIPGKQPSTRYYFYGVASNGGGNSSSSEMLIVDTIAAAATFTPIYTSASGINHYNWYTYPYTAPVTRTYTITATGFDTQISFDGFSGDPDTTIDGDTQTGKGEQTTISLTANQSITISVRAFSTSPGGTLSFSIT